MTDLRKAAASLLSAVDLALPYAPHRHEFDHVADAADDLRAALAAEQAPDTYRIVEWATSTPRKAAALAFTAGPERQAAYWIEWAEARERERWESALGAVMPADLKDWHQNSPSERPSVAAWVISNLREREDELSRLLEKHNALALNAAKLRAEVEALRKFAQSVMEAWPMGDIDGCDLQDLAVDCGLLVPEQRFAPCHEELCSCAEYAQPDEWAAGVECFRKTPLLTGAIDAARAQKGE